MWDHAENSRFGDVYLQMIPGSVVVGVTPYWKGYHRAKFKSKTKNYVKEQ